MPANRMLPAMDIHHPNAEHEKQYFISKQRFPSDESCDSFELFICPYDANHRIIFRRWAKHIENCRKQYGGNRRPCLYNASHHISVPEWDYHLTVCPDRDTIRQDMQGSNSDWKIATPVNHNPVWDQPATSEDNWEDEIEDDAVEFNLNVDKGMPVFLTGKTEENYGEYDYEDYDENEGYPADGLSVLDEELIPERPNNWNDMSKTQKKNHKRKFDRQQQRMQEENITETDFDGEKDPTKWSEQDRQAKLSAIKAAYPTNSEKMHGMKVDYTSLLNVVCQKSKLHLPKYIECQPGSQGGFAYQCQISDKFYKSLTFCSTKRDAKHDCAMWALLRMEIKGLDGSLGTTKKQPVHPRLLQSQQFRESNEIGRLMATGNYQVKKQVPSHPKTESPMKPSSRMQMFNQEVAAAAESVQRSYPQPTEMQPVSHNPPPGFASLANDVSALNMYFEKDFPSLQSEAAWQKVPKKAKGRGRGRGTVMKL